MVVVYWLGFIMGKVMVSVIVMCWWFWVGWWFFLVLELLLVFVGFSIGVMGIVVEKVI